MSTLNLIPDREKKVARREAALVMSMNFGVWLLLTVLVVGIVLSWGKFFLENKLADVQERSIVISETRLVLGDEIRAINTQLRDIDKLQQGFTQWSDILAEVALLVPAGSSLSTLELSSLQNTVVLRGMSPNRAQLLELEENLRGSDKFADVESPLSNLLSPVDINFEFKATLDLTK